MLYVCIQNFPCQTINGADCGVYICKVVIGNFISTLRKDLLFHEYNIMLHFAQEKSQFSSTVVLIILKGSIHANIPYRLSQWN